MAYQEFGAVSSNRRNEIQERRTKILLGVGLTVLLLIFIAAGAFAVVDQSTDDNVTSKKPLSTSNKAVEVMCRSTDYKKDCEQSLKKVLKNHDESDPKNIIKAAIMVVIEAVVKGFSNSTKFKSEDPEVNAAIQDCVELFGHAKDELLRTLEYVDETDIENLPDKSHDIRNWLSAVLSYQQTCVDGFPEGKAKANVKKLMKSGRKMTSNALAIIQEASSILVMLDVHGFRRRRLLESKETSSGDVREDGMPEWASEEERRFLIAMTTENPKPNVTVAKDGSGDFQTINAALNAMPAKYKGRYVIYIKEGIYEETVNITKNMANVTMYGDGSRKTIITGSKNFVDGVRTFHTATVAVVGESFFAKSICFRNTAGAIKHQAVALRVQSDRSVFLNCRMEGYQDTLYAQTHRQFYSSCIIAGTIDFIFGDAAVVFQNCKLIVRKPLANQQNIITAQGRIDRHESTGIVIQNCQIVPDKKLVAGGNNTVRSYLGRPWKEFSRTIIMESNIGGFIHPDGWLPWEGDFGLKTLYYAEYNNKGLGADTSHRVHWRGRKVLKMEEAMRYTVENFIDGANWIRSTGTPVHLSLFSMRGGI